MMGNFSQGGSMIPLQGDNEHIGIIHHKKSGYIKNKYENNLLKL